MTERLEPAHREPASAHGPTSGGPEPPGPRRPRARRTLILGGLAAGVVALGAGAAVSWRRFSLSPEDAQALELFLGHAWLDARHQAYDSQSLRGRPLVLNFWATWCPPCVEEMPELGHLQRNLGATGLQVVGIGIDQAAKIDAFEQRMKLGYPLLVAGAAGAELGRRFGNSSGALPFTVVIDRSGRVRGRILGRFVLAQLESLARAASMPERS